jgi:hypothetical protein
MEVYDNIYLFRNKIINTPLSVLLQPVIHPNDFKKIAGTAETAFTNCVPYATYYVGFYDYETAHANTIVCQRRIQEGIVGFDIPTIVGYINQNKGANDPHTYGFPMANGNYTFIDKDHLVNTLYGMDPQFPNVQLSPGEVTILACKKPDNIHGHIVNIYRGNDNQLYIFDGHELSRENIPVLLFETYLTKYGYTKFSLLLAEKNIYGGRRSTKRRATKKYRKRKSSYKK